MTAPDIAEIAAFEVPPFCAGMAQNCQHYIGGCEQCRSFRAHLEAQAKENRDA
jgi:hypothetical protein